MSYDSNYLLYKETHISVNENINNKNDNYRMCGILLTDKNITNLLHIIEHLINRGPDGTNLKRLYGFTFVHTLLSMTGLITPQPFIEGQIVAMFNGEIYNYKSLELDDTEYDSDGHCLIPLYKKYGTDFITKLDGEYCLILCDFTKNIMIISTDIFSTKPLWLAIDQKDNKRELGVCSYRSSLDRLGYKNIMQVSANTTLIIDLENKKILKKQPVITFDLNQHKDTYDDIVEAIKRSIMKRTNNIKHGVFIGLSSGYDSGSISCILNNLEIPYTAYSILGIDDIDLIDQRHTLLKNGNKIDLDHQTFINQRDFLTKYCDPYYLTIDNGENCRLDNLFNEIRQSNPQDKIKLRARVPKLFDVVNNRLNGQLLTNDNGAIGVSYICKLAKENGQLVYLSGSGADEIFSDYGFNGVKFYGHSTIGGKFPDKLESVFPWKNFFDNTQRAYLMKEEYVTGSFGIEGRYPFLDRDVVQEFLWLKPELKNNNYKSPLHHLMTNYNYPFITNEKIGFNCGFFGPENGYIKRNRETFDKSVNHIKRPDLIVDFSKVKGGRNGIVCFPKTNIKHYSGYCYSCTVNVINDLGLVSGLSSDYKLMEDHYESKLGNTSIETIVSIGRGRFYLETSNTIYFSALDNSDPRVNNKYYRLVL